MKKRYRTAGGLMLALAVVCFGVGGWEYIQEKCAGDDYTQLQKNVSSDEQEKKDLQVEAEEKTSVEIPIDFAALQERNPDVYAWIRIPGTKIDYPILQSRTDDQYYLTHTINGEEKAEGAIYTEHYNSQSFEDLNTVIYGHDMRNGSMFQNLHNYEDQSFFDQNREVIIYTSTAIRHYRIFAAYLYDDRHLMQSFDFTDKGVYRAYLNMIFSIRDMNAHIDTSMDVGTDDRIITLSTCYGNQEDKRYLVQAVLVSIEQ